MKATKVNAGLAESNGRLLLGIWRDSLHVTCGLTACTPGSAPGPTLGNEYGKTLPLVAHSGSPGQRAVKWRRVCVIKSKQLQKSLNLAASGWVGVCATTDGQKLHKQGGGYQM